MEEVQYYMNVYSYKIQKISTTHRYHPLLLRSASQHQKPDGLGTIGMHARVLTFPDSLQPPPRPTSRRRDASQHRSDGRYAARPSYFSLQRKLTLSGIVYGWNLGIELFASELFLE